MLPVASRPLRTARAPRSIGRAKPFVGRRTEMARLKDALKEARAGRGKVVMLAGEPGIGKTRTAEELCRIARRRGVDVAWGACFQDALEPLYWPWSMVIQDLLRIRGPAAIRRNMGAGASAVAAMMPSLVESLPRLPSLKPMDDPVSARFRFSSSVGAFLSKAASERPLLIVLDDLHWADGPSLQLLSFLSRDFAVSGIMVLGTYRDVEVSRGHPLHKTLGDLARDKVFERIPLQGLQRDDIRRYLAILGGAEPPDGLVEGLISQTDGNAFLCTETIRLLREEGRLTVRAAPDGGIRLPESVREVVGRRLDRLSRDCSEALFAAAAVGRELELRVVGRIMGGIPAADLMPVVDEAAASGQIEVVPDFPHRYRFDHELTRQTLIQDRPPGALARLHARIAQALEEAYGVKSPDHARELAEHLSKAQSVTGPEKLLRYLSMAGEQALSSHGYEDARRYFTDALALQGDSAPDEQTADLLFGLGKAQIALLDGEAIASFRKAFDIHERAGRAEKAVAVAAHPISHYSFDLGAIRLTELESLCGKALAMAEKGTAAYLEIVAKQTFCDQNLPLAAQRRRLCAALRMARAGSNPGLEIRILSYLIDVEKRALDFEAVGRYARREYRLAVHEGDLQTQCCVLNDVCSMRTAGVSLGKGLSIDEQFRIAAEKLRDQGLLHLAYFECDRTAYSRGDWARGREMNEKCLALLPPGLINTYALMHRATIEYQTGFFEAGDLAFAKAVEFARGLPRPDVRRSSVAKFAADLMLVSGRSEWIEAAERFASDALADPSNSSLGRMYGEQARGTLAVIRADPETAAACHEALHPLLATVPLLRSNHIIGLLSRTAGRIDSAVRELRRAIAQDGPRNGQMWNLHYLAETLFERSHRGDREEAERTLDRVLEMAGKTGSTLVEGRAKELRERMRVLPFTGAGRKRPAVSPIANWRSWTWSPRAGPTRRSAPSCPSARPPSIHICGTSSRKQVPPTARRHPRLPSATI